ncbi:putative bifunctional diguanylate cyclase/phosphodiesterase [Conexibacter woesei]|uniref:putative bifunctional diguanylate cyclase/phosphodiesterase n=1 Tax=Conexibacter woesei TaxID=191495 RepID=UPI0003F7DB49|nr:EAL domain-containing protein [Conexibacter woesei]
MRALPFRLLLTAAATVAILAIASVSVLNLSRDAHRRADDRTAVQRLRSNLVRAQAVGWHGLAEGSADFTIAQEARQLQRQIARETGQLRDLPGGDADHQRVTLMVDELLTGIGTEMRDLNSDNGGAVELAHRDLTITLLGTTDLLDSALSAAERHAVARASAANTRLVEGSLAAIAAVGAVLAAMALLIRRTRRRAAERFRALVEQSSEILVVLDAAGHVTDVTAAALNRTLGREPQDILGRPILELIDAPDRDRATSALQRLRAEPDGPRPAFEVAVRHHDGSTVHLEAVGDNLLATPAVGGLVLTLRDVTERRSMEDELRHQAFHDALTGLPNRSLFDDRLAQALRRRHRADNGVAVVLVDLDDFKAVNDSLGHAAGDELLVECARRFDLVVRGSDTAARLGGDEFAVLLEDNGDAEAAALQLAARLREALDAPVELEGRTVHVEASIGIAVVSQTAVTPADVVRNADIAMYKAKEHGGSDLVVFRPEMLHAARERLDLREDLRHALERDELALHYQPVVGLGDRGVTCLEALLRWTHPGHGDISPARFIPVAEESGLIVGIGEWVLERACRDLGALRAQIPGVRVAVNVSAVQLREPGFPERVAAILEQCGTDARDLVIELTESVFADDDATAEALRRLRALGLALSVDDFGTGYSSLSYLRRLDVDSVKIDRSFVAGLGGEPRDAALVRSIIELGHALGLTMVAEGVEEADQEAFLREAGCDLAQGWLFGRPAPLLAVGHPSQV